MPFAGVTLLSSVISEDMLASVISNFRSRTGPNGMATYVVMKLCRDLRVDSYMRDQAVACELSLQPYQAALASDGGQGQFGLCS